MAFEIPSGRFRVNIRRCWPVNPKAEMLGGKTFYFECGWVIEEGDSTIYVGEYAMIPDDADYPTGNAPSWLASGDLIRVSEDA